MTNLEEVRKIVYGLQRPGISPELVYPHGEFSRRDERRVVSVVCNFGADSLLSLISFRSRLGRGRYGSLPQPR